MEGVLFVRKRRSKLLHTWQKRYVVLTREGVLKEYAEATTLAGIAGSGMTLKQELPMRTAHVVALPFPLSNRPHSFRVKKKKSFRITLAAKNAEQMNQWIEALRKASGVTREDSGSTRRVERPRAAATFRANRLTAFASSVRATLRSMELPSSLSRTSENEFTDLPVRRADELLHLLQISEWNNHRLRTVVDCTVGGNVPIVRGSMVVAVNGISLQTLSEEEAKAMLRRPSRLPVQLRWLRSPYKRGVLKCKLCYGLTTQLKTIAMYRNGFRAWKDQVVEIDGDVLTCQPVSDDGKETNRSVIPLLGGCTVKPVHEMVAEQRCCFLVSVKAYSMLFQAASSEELHAWVDAIQRAINIAEGCIPGFDLSLDDLQLESSVNMRNRGGFLPDSLWKTEEDSRQGGDDDDDEVSDEEDELSDESDGDEIQLPRRGSEFPDEQLTGMLEFLQTRGRFIEALQLMASESSQRAAYWRSIFQWAMDDISSEAFDAMLHHELNPSDAIQVQKDVPRTSQWLAGSAGAPSLETDASKTRLQALEHVLHAFLISCESDVRTDARSKSSADLAEGKSFYMQGMNGIAFLILSVVGDDQVLALRLLRGVVTHILPHVFGIRTVESGGDNFDLFTSLIEVGNVLEEVVQMHLPSFHEAMEQVGLPVCLLAYKWFPTLFSDISLMAHRSQLRFDTLLAIWDVCLLLGIEGMFCVALALFSAAEEEVVTLRAKNASAETVTGAIITVLVGIEPHELTVSVCEVLELCNHPVLLKLRNGHRRRLQQWQEAQTTAKAVGVVPADLQKPPSDGARDMTVRDLDSGKLFRISNTGSMLLPMKPSISRGVSQ